MTDTMIDNTLAGPQARLFPVPNAEIAAGLALDDADNSLSADQADRLARLDTATATMTDASLDGRADRSDDTWGNALAALDAEGTTATGTNHTRLVAILDEMSANEAAKAMLGFSQVDLVMEFTDAEGWLEFNSPSFNKFFSEHPSKPFHRSSAFRYQAVGNFIRTFNETNQPFDLEFFNQWGIDIEEVRRPDGSLDEVATLAANPISRYAKFNEIGRVAQAFHRGRIDAAKARELTAKSIILDGDDFDREMKAALGKTESVADDLADRGYSGPCFIVPITDDAKLDAFIDYLNDRRAKAIEDEISLTAAFHEFKTQPGAEIGSKSVKFYDFEGQTVVGYL